eukprot:2740272-Prymnesium_polylepis.1
MKRIAANGSTLGDPIEVRAVVAALRERSLSESLHIGSVKGNIGHAESASVTMGLTKQPLNFFDAAQKLPR